MNNPARWMYALLALYSVGLIGIECFTSQDYVRHYVSDVEGPVRFYAVNTTLSVFMLWATALLFGVGLWCASQASESRRTQLFLASQIAIFAWLGLDDRFRIHEYIAEHASIGDHYVLIAVGLVELLCLTLLGWQIVFRRRVLQWLSAAAVLFVVMLFFDAVMPHDGFLRLSIEDVAKTWAALCFCMFAWSILLDRMEQFVAARQSLFAGAAR